MTKNRSVLAMTSAAGIALALLVGAGAAQARDVNWSIGVGVPGVVIGAGNSYYPPPPVYVAPRPIYYAPPPPVYYAPPRPVYYAPPAYYAPPPVVYYGYGDRGHRHGRHHGRGHDRGHDRHWNR